MHSGEPLQYPPHFPPTGKWRRFFLGIRWLGPDTSFFSDLRAAQSARTPGAMDAWGGSDRKALASAIGAVFAKYCDWPSPYFLPGDSVSVVAGGSTFGWLDNTDPGEAIAEIHNIVGVEMPAAFWEASATGTMGQLVDNLIVAGGA